MKFKIERVRNFGDDSGRWVRDQLIRGQAHKTDKTSARPRINWLSDPEFPAFPSRPEIPHPFDFKILVFLFLLLSHASLMLAADSELADAAMQKNAQAVRALLKQTVDANVAQADGTT